MSETASQQGARVAVVIVNYGTAPLTIQAVDSVLRLSTGGVDIHVVDNASPGEDARILSDRADNWPDNVTLHLEDRNHGFGRGINLVLDPLSRRADPPDFVLFLNPDAQCDNDVPGILARFLEDHPKAGFAGARIAKPGHGPVTAAFRFPSLISVFSHALCFGPVDRLLGRWRVPLPPDLDEQRVDWVSGAAVMARMSTLREVGFFDPVYFLYYEEVDLMRRAADHGWETWHVPEARALHLEGAATGVRSGEGARKRRPAYWYASWYHYFTRNHGRLGAMVAAVAAVTGAALNAVLAFLRRREPNRPLHFFHDFTAMVLRPLLGLEARPYE